MSKKPRDLQIIKRKDRQISDITRMMEIQAEQSDLKIRVMAKLSLHIQTQIQFLQLQKGLYGGRVVLYFKVTRRADVLNLMIAMKPLPLTLYKLNRKRKIWCAAAGGEPAIDVLTRTSLAPFTLDVAQGASFGPKVTIHWVTRIGDLHTTVEVEVVKDPAYFTLEENGARLNALKRWRWVTSLGFPRDARLISSFDHWQTAKGADDAYATCYWPMSRIPTHLWNIPIEAARHCLLDDASRWEGHHKHEKT